MTSNKEQEIIDEAQDGFDDVEDARTVEPDPVGQPNAVNPNGPEVGGEGQPQQQRNGMPKNKFRQLVTRGKKYREEVPVERFGEEVTIEVGPLKDPVYQQLLELMEAEMGKERFNKLVTRQQDTEADEFDSDALSEDDFDLGQIGALRLAAKLGIDPQSVGPNEDRESIADLVDDMTGGLSMEIGVKVMELSTEMGDADFPGARNRE
jgi:hypothetical protein